MTLLNIPKVIGVTGIIGSGKDTAAKMIVDSYGYDSLSFATCLKDILSVIFGWDRDLIEGLTTESRVWREQPDEYWSKFFGYPFSPRLALQQVGTDLFRYQFHEDIWVAGTKKNAVNILNQSETNKIIFSDCRFLNEVVAARELGGIIIEIQPAVLPDWYNMALEIASTKGTYNDFIKMYPEIHVSEYGWIGHNNPDIIIKNNGTLDDLLNKILSVFG